MPKTVFVLTFYILRDSVIYATSLAISLFITILAIYGGFASIGYAMRY